MIVTIGRQNGSGGREVGQILAEKMGVRCYDRTLVEATAEKAGMTVEQVEREEERSRTRSMLFFGGIPSSNPIFEAQCEVIRDLASQGSCVFVGRCADRVLADRKDVLRVFVTAPTEDRIKRSAARNGITEEAAAKRIAEKDASRAEYYARYTGLRWGDVANYHLSLDSGPIGVDGVVKVIMEYMWLMDGHSDQSRQ